MLGFFGKDRLSQSKDGSALFAIVRNDCHGLDIARSCPSQTDSLFLFQGDPKLGH
jgi:hypothetical protein